MPAASGSEVPWDVLVVAVVLLTVSAGLDGASAPSSDDDPLPQTFTAWQSPRIGEGVIGKNSQYLKIGFFAFILKYPLIQGENRAGCQREITVCLSPYLLSKYHADKPLLR